MSINPHVSPGELKRLSDQEYKMRHVLAEERRQRAAQIQFEDRWVYPVVMGLVIVVSIPLIPLVAPFWLLGRLAMFLKPTWFE